MNSLILTSLLIMFDPVQPDTSVTYKFECYLDLVANDSSGMYGNLGHVFAEPHGYDEYILLKNETLIINSYFSGLDCPNNVFTYLFVNEALIDSGYSFALSQPGLYKFFSGYGTEYLNLKIVQEDPLIIKDFQTDITANSISFSIFSMFGFNEFQYAVYNISGLQLINGAGSLYSGENSFKLDLSHLPNGCYIIKIITPFDSESLKFYI